MEQRGVDDLGEAMRNTTGVRANNTYGGFEHFTNTRKEVGWSAGCIMVCTAWTFGFCFTKDHSGISSSGYSCWAGRPSAQRDWC
ncbi:hypothetical protein [Spirosoma pomorum]